MKIDRKHSQHFYNFYFIYKSQRGEVGDRGEDVARWLGTSKPQKTFRFSMFFIIIGHCVTPYSKPETPCAWLRTAFWRPAPRQLQSDGSLRLLTLRSSASDMLLPPINTMFSEVFRARDSTGAPHDSLAQSGKFPSFVSMRDMPL
jgi:hypothetical protein